MQLAISVSPSGAESEKQAKDTNVGGVKNGESGDSVEKLSKNELPTSPSVVEADV